MTRPSRQFVPFDDTYNIPFDGRVVRGVRVNDLLFTGGQVDLDGQGRPFHANDLAQQTVRSMELLFDVVRKAGLEPGDIVYLHALYVADDEASEQLVAQLVRKQLANSAEVACSFTPLASFPTAGVRVEIDAIAIAGSQKRLCCFGDDGAPKGINARRLAFLVEKVSQDRVSQPGEVMLLLIEQLRQSLSRLELSEGDVCAVRLYVSDAVSVRDAAECGDLLAKSLSSEPPVFSSALVPRFPKSNELLRLEVIAVDKASCPAERRIRHAVEETSFSQALAAGDLVFVGGQTEAGSSDGTGDDLENQTHSLMRKLREALASVGCGMEHIVKIEAFFAGFEDMVNWQRNAQIRSGYYVRPGPAATGVEVPRVDPPGALISVGCIAVRDTS